MDTVTKHDTMIPVTIAMDKDEVWSNIFGSGFEILVDEWVHSIVFLEGDWDKHGVVELKYEDPNTGNQVRKTLTIVDIANAVSNLTAEGWTHCGGDHVLDDPDACVGDAVIQYALFGEFIYG